jgi:hypothetical protein
VVKGAQEIRAFISQLCWHSLLSLLPPPGGVPFLPFALNDAAVSVPADRHDAHGGHEQREDLAGGEAAAEQGRVGSERPLLEQQLPQGDWHREKAEEEVRGGLGSMLLKPLYLCQRSSGQVS